MKFFNIILFLSSSLLSQTAYEIAEKVSSQSHPDDVKAKRITSTAANQVIFAGSRNKISLGIIPYIFIGNISCVLLLNNKRGTLK